MKLAVISPVSMLQECSTDYHLVLTQYYRSLTLYRSFYRERREAGDFVILDNGAAEKKASLAASSLMDAVEDLRPSIVVAPDVLHDAKETFKRTDAFLFAYMGVLRKLRVSVMGVPQGKTEREWMSCYDKLNADSDIAWLGISMFCPFRTRLEALEAIEGSVAKPCHLLGLWDNPYALLKEKKFDFVKGVDTAKPVEFALEGLRLEEWAKHKHIADDWFIECRGLSGVGAIRELARENIEEMKEIVR